MWRLRCRLGRVGEFSMNSLPLLVIAAIAARGMAVGQVITGIRNADFANFSYPVNRAEFEGAPPEKWLWLDNIPTDKLALKRGRYSFGTGDPRSASLTLETVKYGALLDDGSEEAVVDVHFNAGGTAGWDYLYVYAPGAAGQPRLLGVLRSGCRADGGLLSFALTANRFLVLDFFGSAHRFADCCSSKMIRVRYRFHGDRVMQEGAREEVDRSTDE